MHNNHQTSPDRQEVSQRALDFWQLLETQADNTPQARTQSQSIRDRQHIVVAPPVPVIEYAI